MTPPPADAGSAGEAAAIPTRRFATADLPERAQFDTWAGFSPHWRFVRTADGGFHAEVLFWMLEGAVVSAQILDPFAMERGARDVTTTAAHHVSLVLFRDGASRFSAPGLDQDCGAGDIVFCDPARPARYDNMTHQRTILVAMSRAWLEMAVGPIAAHGRLPRTGETRLLGDFLVSLVERLPAVRPASLPRLSRVLRDMVANALTAADPAHDAAGPSGAKARARAYIAAQPPGTLDAARMAGMLGLTRSCLYRLFRQDGGVMAYDRKRRLGLLHRAVSDPEDRRRVSQIGHDLGFPDPAHLARLFRRSFGYSMTDLQRMRAPCIAPRDPACGAAVVAQYRTTVGRLV